MLTVAKFVQCRLPEKLHFAKRKAVLAVHDQEVAQLTSKDRDCAKTDDQKDIIRTGMSKMDFNHDDNI